MRPLPRPRRPRLAVIGDVHWRPRSDHPLHAVLEHVALQDVDGVLLVGDLVGGPLHHTTRQRPEVVATYLEQAAEALARVAALGRPMLWVPGNHDLPNLSRASRLLDAYASGDVDGGVAELAGLRVAGVGGAGPERFGFCYEWSEDEIRARRIPACDVLLCHTPPRDTPLDVTASGEHVGSVAIRELAEKHAGALVCGHIHESAGALMLGSCLAMNPGGLGAPFGGARVGYLGGVDEALLVDLDQGTWTQLARDDA